MPPFATPKPTILDSFLSEIVSSIRTKNGARITELIHLDFDSLSPERQKPYAELNRELNTYYPASNDGDLVVRCKNVLSQDEFGTFSTPFSDSIVHYFRYLRDFTTADNRAKASKIRQLTSQCVTALGDSKYGVIMIPIVLSFSRTLAAVATNLDRSQSSINLANNNNLTLQAADGDSTSKAASFVESTANVLRDAFIKCLAGSPGAQRHVRPTADDKRIGIYLTANSCLKLLTQCRKLRNAQQMFSSIDAQSPPLSFYPAAQRVTYLYYLGRYHFANNHFRRAERALQSAYEQCHRQAIKHRRLILIYLIAANICLGRFPSSASLLSRPEAAADLAQRFLPLCKYIQTGDLGSFYQYLDLESSDNASARWFLHKSILLQLSDRCEILVWRSLFRQTFRLVGFHGEEKKVPFLRLHFVQRAAAWSVGRMRPQQQQQQTQFGQGGLFTNGGGNFNGRAQIDDDEEYIDPEFLDIDAAIAETGFDLDSGQYLDITDPTATPFGPALDHDSNEWPTIYEIESTALSLIQQGLLRGFALHTNPRFAIPGSQKLGGPMRAGFPEVAGAIKARMGGSEDEEVPGWVR